MQDARPLSYVADYRINLLEPACMSDEDIAGLKTDLKDGILTIPQASNKAKLTDDQFIAEMRKAGF